MNNTVATIRMVSIKQMGMLLCAVLGLCVVCGAADQPVIINMGEATVLALPDQVEFRFVRHFSADTLEEAMDLCDTFLKAAPAAIRGSELQPVEIRVAPPIVTALASHQTQASFTVRFSMAAFNTAQTGPRQLAALMDNLMGLAETMHCTLAGPLFIASDEDTLIANAVARATENAYPPADAVASAVSSTIFAVDKVEVLHIEWVQQPDNQVGEVPQLGCLARVQVTYALAPTQQ